jgi:hypothetical protein
MKTTGRRANNQPEAARTSVFEAERRAVPFPVIRDVKKVPNPGTRARADGAAVFWTAPDAGVGWVNHMQLSVVVGVVGEN